jgi:hypothetical protein
LVFEEQIVMAREPSYPKDAAVGKPAAAAPASREPATPDSAAKGETKRTKHLVTGAAIGALLYANRNRKT